MNSIKFDKRILPNGLTTIVHRDNSTAMASVNLLYRVGARNESSDHTGLAHLCEHLMFSGSQNVPNFDEPLIRAAGENNAFTNNDYTNYYIALPAVNIETALFVEADRMESLTLSEQSLEVQRKVVVEEFAQRYTNQPYGDLWHLLRAQCYDDKHPYSWPTIGLNAEHIEKSTLSDVREFYNRYYTPENAILSIVSPYDSEHVFGLVDKWFGGIEPKGGGSLDFDFSQFSYTNKRISVERDVAASMIYICFQMEGRTSRQATVLDVATDLLSGGESSRLVQRLVKGEALFSSINAYITAEQGTGLLVVTGRLMDDTTMEEAEAALWRELRAITTEPIDGDELQKVRNKYEANNYFSLINSLNKAMNLAYYEFLESADLINTSVEIHASVGEGEIVDVCRELFVSEKSVTLLYNKR